MTAFGSNEEFFAALRALIDRWCDQRRLRPLARLLPGYLAFNGLTDGWSELHAALLSTRSLGPDGFLNSDWKILGDLVSAAEKALHREGS